ncbi:nuclear transport factor 2 family protein [Alkalilimnicola ehrlichii]|nr:nuclear transport factor 2 family protein [Alkalilimnicola ehrlichii]
MKHTEQFLREFNEAWAREDAAAILAAVTDDIRFRMANEAGVGSKEDFAKVLNDMQGSGNTFELAIDRVIVGDGQAAVNGEMRMTDTSGQKKIYAFCDIYTLRGDKISEMMAYVMEKAAS